MIERLHIDEARHQAFGGFRIELQLQLEAAEHVIAAGAEGDPPRQHHAIGRVGDQHAIDDLALQLAHIFLAPAHVDALRAARNEAFARRILQEAIANLPRRSSCNHKPWYPKLPCTSGLSVSTRMSGGANALKNCAFDGSDISHILSAPSVFWTRRVPSRLASMYCVLSGPGSF